MPAQFYKINKSPLFGRKSSKKLCEILGISRSELERLADPGLYNEFESKDKKNPKKKRWVQEPIGIRKKLHKRLHKLIAKIESPDFLCSGKRGISIRKNAEIHERSANILTLDIQKFYESTNVEYVLRFFLHDLKIENDLALKLAKACTCKGRIPTGSPLSQVLAYWSYRRMFEAFDALARKHGMVFSLYVDDMTFSSPNRIPGGFHLKVSFHLKRLGLRIKNGKIEYFKDSDAKTITGNVITRDGKIVVRNSHAKKIQDKIKEAGSVDKMDLVHLRSLIQAAQIVQPGFMNTTLVKCKVLRDRMVSQQN